MTMMIDIAALDDIPRQGARVVKTDTGCVAVFRTADDQVFELDDRCPHKGGPLSEGIVHVVVNGRFAVRDERPTGTLAGRPLLRGGQPFAQATP